MLTVPRLDILDSLDNTEDILSTLDSRGARGCIDSVNWPEVASYRPMAQFAIAYTVWKYSDHLASRPLAVCDIYNNTDYIFCQTV